MDHVWFVAATWLLLALVAVLAANWLRISTALSEIVVGTVAQLVIGALVGGNVLDAKAEWITFLAGTGAIVLTFSPAPNSTRTCFGKNGKNRRPWDWWDSLRHFSGRPWLRTTSWVGLGDRLGWPVWRFRPLRWPWCMQ